jgi:hypothetical protein
MTPAQRLPLHWQEEEEQTFQSGKEKAELLTILCPLSVLFLCIVIPSPRPA